MVTKSWVLTLAVPTYSQRQSSFQSAQKATYSVLPAVQGAPLKPVGSFTLKAATSSPALLSRPTQVSSS